MNKFLLIALMSMLLITSMVSAREVTCSDEGIVSLWEFDETSGNTASDSCGSNDGIVNGTANWTTGKYGNALYFDGTENYIDIPNDASLVVRTGNFSVSAWIKRTIPCGTQDAVFDKYDEFNDDEFDFYCDVSYLGLYASDGVVYPDIIGTTNVTDGEWHFVVAVREDNRTAVYVDGVLDAEDNATGLVDINNTANATIGTLSVLYAPQFHFDEYMDDIAVWNIPLSQTQIEDLYAEAVIPTEPSYTSGAVYQAFEESGAGLGVFISYLTIPTYTLLLTLTVIVGIAGIITALVFAIRSFITSVSKK